jgi:hypothetical protein
MSFPLIGRMSPLPRTARLDRESALVSTGLQRGVLIACAMSLPVWLGAFFAIFG